ncbi:MAG: O-antigen ligase family protein [Elusimicrobia bacterium]|nr:O-antigen ligase family protein [Elusimicrobiota bacterium]
MIDNSRFLNLKNILLTMLLTGSVAVPGIPHQFGDTLIIVLIWCFFCIWLTQMIVSGTLKTRLTVLNKILLVGLAAALIGLVRSPHLYESLQAFLKLTALFMFGLVILNYENRARVFSTIVKTTIWLSVALSILAVYEYYFGLWGAPAYGRVQVLFPNPNHFAGFIALAMTFALSVLLSAPEQNWFRWLTWLSLVTGLAALVLTASKGGALSLCLGFSLVLFYKRKVWSYVFITGILLVLIAILITPLKETVFNREINDPFTYEKKELYAETFRYLRDYPILGTGLETFKYYYPRYKSMPELRSAPYVHNEILNLWSDLGVLGVFALVWGLVIFFSRMHLLIYKENRFYLIAFMSGVAGILAQSMFEFNLHDPALALLFTGMICSGISLAKEEAGKMKTVEIRRPVLSLVLVWAVLLLAGIILLCPLYAQNQAEKGELALTSGNYLQAIEYYQTAVKYNPLSAEIRSRSAQAYYLEGKLLKDEIFLWAAQHYLEKATQLEPLNPFRWRDLAFYHARFNRWAEARAAYARVIALAPNVEKFKKEFDSWQKNWQKTIENNRRK